jgi:hypothetical protein
MAGFHARVGKIKEESMARKNSQTFGKRQREQVKQQKRQAKSEKKALRKSQRGEDPEPVVESST